MPRLEYTFDGDAFADGAGGDKHLIDLSEELSGLYGKLVRQGQIFYVKGVDIRLVNPNTAMQDEVMAVSGKLIWYHPTAPRLKAWKVAFAATQAQRKMLGNTHSEGYDFRVGFGPGYSTDVGAFGTGVKYNAWLNSSGDPLLLSSPGDTDQDIFGNWNANLDTSELPKNPHGGFGHWAQKDAAALLDELDFVTHEDGFYIDGAASLAAQTLGWQLSFTSLYESAIGATEAANSVTNASRMELDAPIMLGLIGIYIDTTTIDDELVQTQDWRVEISVDVEKWSPIFKGRKKSRRSKR